MDTPQFYINIQVKDMFYIYCHIFLGILFKVLKYASKDNMAHSGGFIWPDFHPFLDRNTLK